MAGEETPQVSTQIPGSVDISSQYPGASGIENGIAYKTMRDGSRVNLGPVKGMDEDQQGDQPPAGFTEKPLAASVQPPAGATEKPLGGDKPPEGATEKPISTNVGGIETANALIPAYLQNDPHFQELSPKERAELLARHARSRMGKDLGDTSALSTDEAQQAHSDRVRDTVADFLENVRDGAAGSFAGGVEGASKLAAGGLRKLGAHKLADEISNPNGTGLLNNLADSDEHARGVGGAVGVAADNILEFFAGDEAFKALGEGFMGVKAIGKSQFAANILKWAKANPFKAATLSAAVTGLRQGTVTGAQELAHGADAKAAAWSALMNAGMGGMFDALGSMSQAGSKAVRVAGKAGTVAAGTSWGLSSLYDALLPRQEGESEQDAINRRVSAAAGVVMSGDAIDPKSVYEHTIQGVKEIYDAVRSVPGKAGVSTDIAELFKRAANKYGKQGADELYQTAKRAESDLTAILNKNQGKISDLNDVGAAIDDHMKEVGDKPLMDKAKATQDDVTPVTSTFRKDASERLDEFFKDNAGRYTPEQEEALRSEFWNRVSRPHDVGNGTEIQRDPNLFETENARRTMSEDAFSRSQSSSAQDGATARSRFLHDMADFLREKIDEGYERRGVSGVKEFRSKEADLINLRDAAYAAQDAFDREGIKGVLGRLGGKLESALVYGAILTHITGTGLLGTITAANRMWKHVQKFNTTDMHANLEKLLKTAQKTPGARATVPTFGPEPPMVGAPGGPEGPTQPFLGITNPPVEGPQGAPPTPPFGAPGGPVGPKNIPPGFPPMPQPPAAAKPPAVDHDVYATLATFFRHWKGDPNTPPYEVLLQQFKDHAANVHNFAENANDPNYKGPKYTPEQIEKVDRVQAQVNKSQAAADKFVEKQNAANQAKYQRDLETWQNKLRAEHAKAAEAQEEEAEKIRQGQKTVADQKKDDIVAALEKDERVAHGPYTKSTERAADLPGLGDRTSQQAYRHDYGHIMTAVAEGLDPIDMLAEGHESAQERDAALLTRVDARGLKPGTEGVFQHIVFLLGGPAFDEIHHDMPLSDNPGASGDIREVRRLMREKLGLTPGETNEVFDKLYDRAKEHVSNPEALSIVDANAPLRESNLHPNWAISRGRMKDLATKMRGVYGGQEKASGTSTGSERAPDGGDGGTPNGGGKGGKQAGNVEGVPAGQVRGNGEANGEAAAKGRGKAGAGAEAGAGAGREISDTAKAERGGRDLVTVYHGEGGAAGGGRGGGWWTTDAKRAASYGGEVTTVQVPREEFEAGQKAAREQGSGTKGDAILDMKWHDKAVKADVEPDVYEIGDEAGAAFTPGKPKERSTGDDKTDTAIKKGGGVPGGVQKGFEYKGKKIPDQAYIHDPITGTSVNMPVGEITPERVKAALVESRKKYGIDEEPEEYVSAPMTASPKDQAIVDKAEWETSPSTDYRKLRLKDETGKEIGYIAHDAKAGDDYGRVRISTLDKGWENRGIGKAMYERTFADAQAQGVRQLKSDTSLSPDAERVWKSMMASGKYDITVADRPNEVNRGKPAPFTHNEYTIHFPGEEPEMERLRRTGPATREAIPPTKEEIEGAEQRRERAAAEKRVAEQGLFDRRSKDSKDLVAPFTMVKQQHGPEFHEAIKNTPGASVDEKTGSVTLDLSRRQDPAQAGERSVRSGVFFTPEEKSPYARHYTGRHWYGGSQKIVEKQVTLKNPLVAKGSTGGIVPQRVYDYLKGTNAHENMRKDVLDNVVFGAFDHRDEFEKERRVGDLLEKYGADRSYAPDIVMHSKKGNQLSLAIQEHIVAQAIRDAGHDSAIGFSKHQGQPRLSEVFDASRDVYPTPQEETPETIDAAFTKPETKKWFEGSKVVDEKGEPLRVYHGTRASEDFEHFSTEGRPAVGEDEEVTSGSGPDPTSYMGAHFAVEPEVANKFAAPPRSSWMASRYEPGEEKPRVIPAYLSLKNPKDFGSEGKLRDFIYKNGKISGYAGDELLNRVMEADGIANPEDGGEASEDWLDRYENDAEFRREQNEWIFEHYRPDEGEDNLLDEAARDVADQAKAQLKKMGHDGMKYKNEVEGGTAYTAFEPEQIRNAITEK